MRTVIAHLRVNAVAYLALFVALGGTSYAAVSLPAGSVGNRQIRNHSIYPDKLNPRYIRGSIRIWASVNASGRVVAGGRGVRVVPQGSVPGDYLISPARRSSIAIPRRCTPLASVNDSSVVPGYAEAEVVIGSRGERPRWQIVVGTYSNAGGAVSLPFDVAVVC
jgi:hypothetical protein